MNKKVYGLIGYPLGHSFSKAYFENKFRQEGIEDSVFENFPLESITELPEFVDTTAGLVGFNVTIPYKQAIMPYLSRINAEAELIGAVNCVKVVKSGDNIELAGYNTDAVGFEKSLLDMIGNARPDALILGTGGASKAVAFILKKLGIRYFFISRRGSDGVLCYENLGAETIKVHKLIINTTPLGTFPNIEGAAEIPYEAISIEHFLFDLVYNPSETEFMRRGRIRGATVKNGYQMLVGQAEAAYEIFNR